MSCCALRLTAVAVAIIAGMSEPVGARVASLQEMARVARVTDVYLSRERAERSAGIGDEIAVAVENLEVLTALGRPIRLYVDGRMVPSLEAQQGQDVLYFVLARHADADALWASILGRPEIGERFFEFPVSVSVGVESDGPVETAVDSRGEGLTFHLRRIGEVEFWVAVAVLVLMIGGLYRLARYTDVVRDRAPAGLAEVEAARRDDRRPYSLARVQMAVWFVVVVGSFIVIWIVTGNANTITNSVLGLIGIGTGTALGAAMVEAGKGQSQQQALEQLKEERGELEGRRRTAQAGAAKEIEAQIKDVEKQIKALVPCSDSFLMDLLTDVNGVSIHRFQMMVWTVVLVVLFLHSVWSQLSMPEFNTTLLALQGISGGTYLGFKIPERQS